MFYKSIGTLICSTCILLAGTHCDSAGAEDPVPNKGIEQLLIYNVAGLPQGIHKDTQPDLHMPLISPMLNAFDLVLVQEDFSYHEALIEKSTHPYLSNPVPPTKIMNDGLTRFSNSPFSNFERHTWTHCNGAMDSGNDCLADKGFSVATHLLAKGTSVTPAVEIDIYNLHMDAGSNTEDVVARNAQIEQLLSVLASRSKGRAVIVAGDTNLKQFLRSEDKAPYSKLVTQAQLKDSCEAVTCGDVRIDRVFYRSSETLQIEIKSWMLRDDFVDADGAPLSDHVPIHVEYEWQRFDTAN
jgi:hypothetical protein